MPKTWNVSARFLWQDCFSHLNFEISLYSNMLMPTFNRPTTICCKWHLHWKRQFSVLMAFRTVCKRVLIWRKYLQQQSINADSCIFYMREYWQLRAINKKFLYVEWSRHSHLASTFSNRTLSKVYSFGLRVSQGTLDRVFVNLLYVAFAGLPSKKSSLSI